MQSLSRKELSFNPKKGNIANQFRDLYRNLNNVLGSYDSYGYCTKSCFDLKKMQILLQMSVYENLGHRNSGPELLEKLLTDNEIQVSEMDAWLQCLSEEYKASNRQVWMIKQDDEGISRISLENYSKVYKVGNTPNPVLCLIIARVANESQGEEELISFFKNMDKMLTAFNKEKASKYMSKGESFNFLKFSRAYSWPVDLYEKIGATKKENLSLKSTLQSKEIKIEKLTVDFEKEKHQNQLLVSNSQILQHEMSELQKKYATNCEEIAVLSEHVKQKSLEKGRFKKDAEIKKKEIESTSLKIKEITTENEIIKRDFGLKEKKYKEQISQHESKIQEVETTSKTYKVQIEELTMQKEKLLQQGQHHLKQIEELNLKLSKAVSEKEAVDIKNLELNKELKVQRTNLKQNALKIEELNKELQSLLLKITSNERENSKLNDELKRISTEYEELNNRFQKLLTNAALVEQKLKESELKLMAQVKEKGVVESNFSELKINYNALSQKCEQANNQIMLLSSQLTEKSQEYTKLIDTHKTVIEPKIKNQLEALEKSSLLYSDSCKEIALLNQTISSNNQKANLQLIQLKDSLATTIKEKDQVVINYEKSVLEITNLNKNAEENTKRASMMTQENQRLKERVSEIGTEKQSQEVKLKQLELDKSSIEKKYQDQLELNNSQAQLLNQEQIALANLKKEIELYKQERISFQARIEDLDSSNRRYLEKTDRLSKDLSTVEIDKKSLILKLQEEETRNAILLEEKEQESIKNLLISKQYNEISESLVFEQNTNKDLCSKLEIIPILEESLRAEKLEKEKLISDNKDMSQLFSNLKIEYAIIETSNREKQEAISSLKEQNETLSQLAYPRLIGIDDESDENSFDRFILEEFEEEEVAIEEKKPFESNSTDLVEDEFELI